MPYLMEDNAYKALEEVVTNLADLDKPMTMIEQQALAFVMLFILGEIKRVATPEDDIEDIAGDVAALAIRNASDAFKSLLRHLQNETGGVVMGKHNGVPWFYADELAPEMVGLIHGFLDINDERPMKEQINEHYIGGWRPFDGFKIKQKSWTIQYPGDPDMQPVAGTALHGEVLAVYPHAWVMIVDANNNVEIARMD